MKPLERLLSLADEGYEIWLGFCPSERWPHEADEKPKHKRWHAGICSVPGTDMCHDQKEGASAQDAAAAILKDFEIYGWSWGD